MKYPNELSESARKLLDSIPKTLLINGHDVPEPMREKPEIGTEYWYVDAKLDNGASSFYWDNGRIDNLLLSHGICHLTRDNCIAHAKALFSFSEEE